MLNPTLVKNAPIDNAVDVFKYKGKFARGDWDEPNFSTLKPENFKHACRFPRTTLQSTYPRNGDITIADHVLAGRKPIDVSLKQKFCLPGTTAMREPDFACSPKESVKPFCYMKTKMDPESRFESGSRSAYKWTPPHYWGETKLLPKEWAKLVFPDKK